MEKKDNDIYCGGGTAAERHAFDRANQAALALVFLGSQSHPIWVLAHLGKQKRAAQAALFVLKYIDNNDTVSNSFIWFHSKNETIKRKVKRSFGTETMLISLSNWNW